MIGFLIKPQDKTLVIAFLRREADDYTKIADKDQWALGLYELVAKGLEAHKEASDIILRSLGNTGIVTRELRLEPNIWDVNAAVIVVTLCTCGNLGHWGTITTQPRR